MKHEKLYSEKKALEKIKEIISFESGMIFENFREEILLKRLQNRIQNLNLSSATEYLNYLTKIISTENKKEIDFLITQLTVNETFFFREPQHFNYIKENILPELKNNTIDILHLGCSSGEEPYSAAITLFEFFGIGAEKNFNITACDIDKEILKIAADGKYSELGKNIKNIPPNILKKYFVKDSEFYNIKDIVKKKIKFINLNITNSDLPGKFDIIFCRNVMLYFSGEIKAQLTEKIIKALKNNGYLFIGNTEILNVISQNILHKPVREINVFQKIDKTKKFEKKECNNAQTYDIEKKKNSDSNSAGDSLTNAKKFCKRQNDNNLKSENISIPNDIFEIKLKGLIDNQQSDLDYADFLEEMNKLFETQHNKIIIDLTNVKFIERAALEKIIKAVFILKKSDKKIILIISQNNILSMVARMEIDDLLKIFTNKKDAIEYIK